MEEAFLSEGDKLRGQGGGEYVISSGVPIGRARSDLCVSQDAYSGEVVASGMPVVIKVIDRMAIERHHPDDIEKLTRGLNTARQLRHPNLVHLLDVAFDDARAMQIVEWAGSGGTLADLISYGGPLPEQRARGMFGQILSAVSYCHSRQVYHEDLTLEEVWIVSPGSDTLKIHGFGHSRMRTGVEDVYACNVNRSKVRHGTVCYLSPGAASMPKREDRVHQEAVDIWVLGVMLYVLVCSTYPFGFDGPKRLGGITPPKVYANIMRGAEAVQFPDSMSPELVELLRGTAPKRFRRSRSACFVHVGFADAMCGSSPWSMCRLNACRHIYTSSIRA